MKKHNQPLEPVKLSLKRLLRHVAVSLVAAGPAGGFLFGLLNAGDPDPNPVGRVFYAFIMAAETPLHAGFPPNNQAGAGQSFNVWPHIAISYLLIFGWFLYRDRRLSRKRNEPTAMAHL
jgi:hypothetical protein